MEHLASIFHEKKTRSLDLRHEPVKERILRLKRLKKWILHNRIRIQKAVYADLRKPAEEVDITEIYVVLKELKSAIRNLKYWLIPEPEGTAIPFIGTKAEVFIEPKGVVLIISPWNYPFNLAVGPLVSALAAGNTVVMKPSELSEHTSNLLKAMIEEVFDNNEVQVITGGISTSTELLKLPFDHIFFTGSPRVGKVIMEAAAKNLSSVTLELGGKSPCIVDETAHIKDAATKIAWGKWLNAGQTCLAPDLLFVHESIKNPFISELTKEAQRLYSGENYSSIISKTHYERLLVWKEEAIERGANAIYDGGEKNELRRISPSIIENPAEDTQLNQQEVFGPICVVKTFSNIDEVIREVNGRPKALSAYIFSRSKKNVSRFRKETSAGSFVVNDTVIQYGHPTLPFGGINSSGIGKAHGQYGFLEFSNQKAVLKQRIGFTSPKILYPPFTNFKRLIINLLLKYF